MNLCADIGNTRLKTGLFKGKTLLEQVVWATWTPGELIEYALDAGVENVLYSSVLQPDELLRTLLENHFRTQELNTTTRLPFENRYTTPTTLGKDRLAAVAGAQALFPGENCLVVDCGTCIKYDMLVSGTVYTGGNIAPGVNMRILAMHRFTARLPEVPVEMPEDFSGDSTTTALQNGAIRGACLEIEGFARLYEQRYGTLRVILSGGDADFLNAHLTLPHKTPTPELTLHGLNNLLIFNT